MPDFHPRLVDELIVSALYADAPQPTEEQKRAAWEALHRRAQYQAQARVKPSTYPVRLETCPAPAAPLTVTEGLCRVVSAVFSLITNESAYERARTTVDSHHQFQRRYHYRKLNAFA